VYITMDMEEDMKLSEMFIGQIVMMKEPSTYRSTLIPEVGKVVDISLQYDMSIAIGTHDPIQVCPVVHFVGENLPRQVNPACLCKYKE
jgi:hypothetical protein